MKKILMPVLIFSMFIMKSQAQILTPVTWSYAAKKISATEAVVFIKATIDKGWHIYSQTLKDGGPIKTAFTFTPSKNYSLIGSTLEPKPITYFEKLFNMNVSYFENSVLFQQKVKIKKGTTMVSGKLEYQTCNDKSCLPSADVEFSIPVK